MAYTTIDDPSAHFQTTIFAGTQEARTITFGGNSDLQMDLLWAKERDSAVNWHRVIDTTRGASTSSSPEIYSNADSDETPQAGGEHVKVIGSNSVQIGTAQGVNTASSGMVWWVWKANGGSRTTNAEDGNNPAGGYQANTTAGFSIVDYVGTGAAGTMAHGLGAEPDLIMIKNRDDNDSSWAVYHSANTAAPETDYLFLDTTAATADDDAFWNDTAPTSTVFTVNTVLNVNTDAENYIAYLWKGIQGYSKFGSYEGNGNADGPFVYTGFKPAWLLYRNTDRSENWIIVDHKRNPYNVVSGANLQANEPDAEATETRWGVDFLANGFKVRTDGSTNNANNGDGETIIYMAFAEQPFVTSGGVPCTAR